MVVIPVSDEFKNVSEQMSFIIEDEMKYQTFRFKLIDVQTFVSSFGLI